MRPDKKQEFDPEQRAEFARQFRRYWSFQVFCALVFILAVWSQAFVAQSARIYVTLALGGFGGVMFWGSVWKHNRCPACDHSFGLRLPTRTRKICPACGSQLIN